MDIQEQHSMQGLKLHVSVKIFRVFLNDIMLDVSFTTVSKDSISCFHTFFSLATLHPNFFI